MTSRLHAGMIAIIATLLLGTAGSGLAQEKAAQRPKRKPNPAFAKIEDDPSLPRVLLLGDSISIFSVSCVAFTGSFVQ